jgi:N-formylglutamate amidohydrolase
MPVPHKRNVGLLRGKGPPADVTSAGTRKGQGRHDMMTRRTFVEASAFALTGCALPAVEPRGNDLVQLQRGTLPIILTAPHGGSAEIPGVAPRDVVGKSTTGGASYVISQDEGTDRIAQGIAAEVKVLTRKDVFLVVARFHRKYIDANRPPAVAFDSPAAKPTYDLYHAAIRRFVDEIRSRFKEGLLIDVHGQRAFPGDLVRGTRNGRTVSRLIGRAGAAAITGPNGLFGQFERNGFRVLPGNDVPPSGRNEDFTGLSGGYTVDRYGSHRLDGIDAVQCEFGSRYRRDTELQRSIAGASTALAAFYQTFLA